MSKLFTKEQIRAYLKENDLKDGQSIEDALTGMFKDFIQEALEGELDNHLGYSKSVTYPCQAFRQVAYLVAALVLLDHLQ